MAGFSDDPMSLYLKPGDVVECEIERIGVLRNPVVSWEEAHGEPAAAEGGLVIVGGVEADAGARRGSPG